MGFATRVCPVAVVLVLATVPVSAQDVNDALQSMCEGVEPYDPADVEAVRENADDFCAVLLSEPSKARRQLGKMLVRNRGASNPNRWYIDARKISSRHRHRYDGMYVQLRRPWMGDDWGIDRAPCFDLYQPPKGQSTDVYFSRARQGFLTYRHHHHCFKFTQYNELLDTAQAEDASNVLRIFILRISWDNDEPFGEYPRWYLSAATKTTSSTGWGNGSNCRVMVNPSDPEHGLHLIDDMLDTLPTYGCWGRWRPLE